MSIAKYFSLDTVNVGMEGLIYGTLRALTMTRIVFMFLFETIYQPKNEFNLLDIISTQYKIFRTFIAYWTVLDEPPCLTECRILCDMNSCIIIINMNIQNNVSLAVEDLRMKKIYKVGLKKNPTTFTRFLRYTTQKMSCFYN